MAGKKKHWIKNAIKHPGAFTEKADKAGESVADFATEHVHDEDTTGRQARMAQTLAHFDKHRNKRGG